MKSSKVYRNFLTVAILAALGSGHAWAADAVQLGYTPQENKERKAADVVDDETLAAINAARGGLEEATQADIREERRQRVDNSALTTDDKAVKVVTQAGGDKVETRQEESLDQTIQPVEARFFTSIKDEDITKYEGKVITNLSLEGVDEEAQPQFLGLLQEKVGDKLTADALKGDIVNIGNTGVFSEVTPVLTEVPEGVKVAFKVTVNPVVTAVAVEGNTIYPTETLIKYVNLQPNTVLNTVAVGEKIQGINAAYQRDGYMLAQVRDIAVDEQGVLHILINEGVVERITPHGNKKTKDRVITREFNQKVGKPFNKYLVRRSVEKVYNLGFFDDVNVRLTPGQADGAVNIEVDVLEHKTGTLTLGAGYSGSDGFVGIVEVGEENLRGTGDKVKLHWEFGGTAGYKNYSLSYFRPWIDSKGTSLGVTVFDRTDAYRDYNEDGDEVAEYDRKSKGFNISLGRQTGEFTRDYVTLETRSDKYKWDDDDSSGLRYDTDASARHPNYYKGKYYNFATDGYIDKNFGRINSISWQKVYDSRDNIYDPTRGRRISNTIQWAGHGLGGDFDFYKYTGEFRTYKKVGSKQVLAFRGRIGWTSGDVPYSQLFTVGGADSLRGYEDDQYRGTRMYNFTAEYRFPIWKKVTGALFTDIGDAWNAPNVSWYKHSKSFNYSVGAGLRVTTPIGPIRIDYGVGRHEKKFHFSFGGQF